MPASPAPHAEPALPPPAAAASSQLDEALRGMLQPRTSGEGGIRRHRHGSAIHTHHNPAPRHAATTALQVRPAATDEAEAAPEGDDPPALADDAGASLQASTDTRRESQTRLVQPWPASQLQHARVTREGGQRRHHPRQAGPEADDEADEDGPPATDASRPWDMRPTASRGGSTARRVASAAAVGRGAPLRTDHGSPGYSSPANAVVSILGWGLAAMVVAIVLALLAAAFGPRDADTPRGGRGDGGDTGSRHERQREPADEVRTAS